MKAARHPSFAGLMRDVSFSSIMIGVVALLEQGGLRSPRA